MDADRAREAVKAKEVEEDRAGEAVKVRAADVDKVRGGVVDKEWVPVEIVSAPDAARLQHTNRVFPVMNRYARNAAAK